MVAKHQLQGAIQDIPIDRIKPMELNPNKMSKTDFARLTKELEATGFIDPLQVVALKDGNFRLIGGEHRVDSARELGWPTVPCVVLDGSAWEDEDFQRFVCMRLNVIRGKVDPEKFAKLYEELAKRYADDVLQEMMGVVDRTQWGKLTKGIREALKQSGMPPEAVDAFARQTQDVRAIEDLDIIINGIFQQYGDTITSDFIVFKHPKSEKKVLYVQTNHALFLRIERELRRCHDLGVSADRFFEELLAKATPAGAE